MGELALQENKQVAMSFFNVAGFELMQRVAGVFAKSQMVPKTYQNNLPDCLVALNMASRLNADPLMVMQNMYIVYGTPSWSSKFLIATFNSCGRFSALRYKWTGTPGKDDYGCIAWAVEKESGEKLEGSEITIEIAKKEGWYNKNGSKWQTMPQQMLMYRAASMFIRTYAPEISMGLYTADEIEDSGPINVTPSANDVQKEIKSNANTEVFKAKDVEVLDPVPEKQKPAKKESEKTKPEPTVVDDEEGPGF